MAKKNRISLRGKQHLYEEGWEDFSLKEAWFKKYRDPGVGQSFKEVYDAALHQARRMKSHIHETPPIPEKSLKKAILRSVSQRKATVIATRNPNRKAAVGFASAPVKISGEESLINSMLYLPLDPKLKRSVDENTICIFRYVLRSHSWAKMPVCGVDLKREPLRGQGFMSQELYRI